MPVSVLKSAFVGQYAASVALSQMFDVTPADSDPAYLVLTALDRNEYTVGESGATGSFSGNGKTLQLTSIGGDARSAGIVFTYQASTGRYYSSMYGYLDQLAFNSSGSAGEVTSLSLFGSSSLSLATAYATSSYTIMEVDGAGYLGSGTVVTQPNFVSTVPAQATPDSIAALAQSMVGQTWNMNGCWTLVSTIAADAGAALPVQSTLVGLPGQSSGEWVVVFNGPNGQSADWQSLVSAGDIVVIGTAGGGGHVTTCVSGSGSTAALVDDIVYTNGSGQVQNPANDGSSSDIIIAAPHPASQEWDGVQAASVVIYALDTPVVSDLVASLSLSFSASVTLASLFIAADPVNKAITAWQVYNSAGSDLLVTDGLHLNDHSASSALTTTSLSAVYLLAGVVSTTDTLEVRAYNGSYWGDWGSLEVSILASAPIPPAPPILVTQTASQTWLGGNAFALSLPTGTFSDPQNERLTYTATLANGQALPGWLEFNAASGTFSGTAPTTVQNLTVMVAATDTSGLSATDTFAVNVLGTPVVLAATPTQTWIVGSTVSLTLPANAFTDPQSQQLIYTATQSDGEALPGWLQFNASTRTFTGTAPSTPASLSLTVTAIDSSGLSAEEQFTANIQAQAPAVKPGIAITAQTPNQTWTDGQTSSVIFAGNTFTDALGLKMTFMAFQVSGPNASSWLRFDPTTNALGGNVPTTASGTMEVALVAVDTQYTVAVDLFSVTFETGTAHVTAGTQTHFSGNTPVDPLVPFGLLHSEHEIIRVGMTYPRI